jgi:hypothetical protein
MAQHTLGRNNTRAKFLLFCREEQEATFSFDGKMEETMEEHNSRLGAASPD